MEGFCVVTRTASAAALLISSTSLIHPLSSLFFLYLAVQAKQVYNNGFIWLIPMTLAPKYHWDILNSWIPQAALFAMHGHPPWTPNISKMNFMIKCASLCIVAEAARSSSFTLSAPRASPTTDWLPHVAGAFQGQDFSFFSVFHLAWLFEESENSYCFFFFKTTKKKNSPDQFEQKRTFTPFPSDCYLSLSNVVNFFCVAFHCSSNMCQVRSGTKLNNVDQPYCTTPVRVSSSILVIPESFSKPGQPESPDLFRFPDLFPLLFASLKPTPHTPFVH